MPRINIYYNNKDLAELKRFLAQSYPQLNAQSLVIRLAVKEYIKNHDSRYEVNNGNQK